MPLLAMEDTGLVDGYESLKSIKQKIRMMGHTILIILYQTWALGFIQNLLFFFLMLFIVYISVIAIVIIPVGVSNFQLRIHDERAFRCNGLQIGFSAEH